MSTPIPPRWVLRHPHWPLVALHVPLTVQVPVYTVLGMDGQAHSPVIPVLAATAAGAVQLRHSLAAAHDRRPAGWPWSYAALLVLAYVPLWWFGTQWESLGIFVAASSMMLLGRLGMLVAVAAVAVGVGTEVSSGGTAAQTVSGGLYALVAFVLYTGALVGGARLVWLVDELYATRTQLAATAVDEERMRVSRDLHDLLGQSLVAISLKGDLALRLLTGHPAVARREIEGLTALARDALRDVRAITRDEHAISLRAEIDGAAALLAAAGIDTGIDVADVPPLPGPAHAALAWAIREGTTNVLKHGTAGTCAITLLRHGATVRLEIVNDGARGDAVDGSGLAGMAERARAVRGTAETVVREGRFRLRFEVPLDAAVPGVPVDAA